MGLLYLCLLLILIENPSLATAGEHISDQMPPPPSSAAAAAAAGVSVFKPSIAIIVGVITTVFSITFLLLLYIKHCKRTTTFSTNSRNHPMLSRENSGINRKVIESLPMFRFSSLRGQKDGLECAVCLNKFDAEEVLRLLPKCKHAFHVECVDTWLDAHSTCPLCRYRVDPEDVLLVDHHERRSSGSSRGVHNHGEQSNTPRNSDIEKGKEYVNRRISGRHSSAGERGSALEIIVENPDHGRISLDSRRKTVKSSSEKWRRDLKPPSSEVPARRSLQDGEKLYRKDRQLPVQVDKHRLEHRIIISGDGDAAVDEDERRRRWSDVEAAEFLYLRSEMILGGGGEEEEEGSERRVINARSVSEITGMSRYRISNIRERKEEGFVKRWLDMDWISHHRQKPAVNSATSSSSSPAIVV